MWCVAMIFQPRRRLGKLLMVVSVLFLMAACYTFFFFHYPEPSLPIDWKEREQTIDRALAELAEHLERSAQYPTVAGPMIPSPNLFVWPYRWLSQPLLIVGISLFVTGLLVGYHDDIRECF